ncbi:RNA polymerase III subunit RPC82-related helix-turn-helix [Trinorchestia longiramus]|nr:RNA polymerase III subunit RPC82-related helix-turn-helix [Trinorchestia longiramus]
MAVLDSLFNAVVFERTAVKIIETNFSAIAGMVVKAMFRSSGISVNSLRLATHLSSSQIQKTLASLAQHNIVSFLPASQRQVHYKLIKSNILYFLQRTKYVQYAREKLGADAELVVEKVLEEGSATSSQIIVATACKLMANTSSSSESGSNEACTDHHIRVRDVLQRLVEQGFLKRMPIPKSPDSWCPNMQSPSDEDLHKFNGEQLDLQAIAQAVTNGLAGASGTTGSITPPASSFPDSKVYWTLDFDTFHLQWSLGLTLDGPYARQSVPDYRLLSVTDSLVIYQLSMRPIVAAKRQC